MGICNRTGTQEIGQHNFAGHDAIAISGRSPWMAAARAHASHGHLDDFNQEHEALFARRGIPLDDPPHPRRLAANWGRPICRSPHHRSFIPEFLSNLAEMHGITISTIGARLKPGELVDAIVAPLDIQYKAADLTGIALICGDSSEPPRTELTGATAPLPVDAHQMRHLMYTAKLLAHLARDLHFPNPHRNGLGKVFDELLPGAIHFQI
ncbi:hypothetical protein ACODT5_38435 [Streptomyces sp. 5.8]|uniref:hypothetical protein n=1 Tax=Streptomyces sp. 5.8 TaxID=3406571 RepID=UPI003BB7A579